MDIIDDHPTRLPVPWTIEVDGKLITTQGARHACRLLSGVHDLEYIGGRFGSKSRKQTLRIARWAKTEEEAWLWMAYEELRSQMVFCAAPISVGRDVEAEHRAWWLKMVKEEEARMAAFNRKA